jgi:hypothetical protein
VEATESSSIKSLSLSINQQLTENHFLKEQKVRSFGYTFLDLEVTSVELSGNTFKVFFLFVFAGTFGSITCSPTILERPQPIHNWAAPSRLSKIRSNIR